jgi:phage replication O-like protein O
MSFRAPNFTQAPNELFDEWLPQLGLAELKVLMVIIRKTFGWHKVKDRISLNQLEILTGLERRHVSKAIKSLCEKRLICKFVEGKVGQQITYYELIVEENSNNLYGCPKDTGGGVLKTPTKETNTKEKINTPIVPTGDPPLSTKKSKKTVEEKKEVAERVFVSASQHENLIKRAKGNVELVKQWYDRLSAWKIGKEIYNGKNDYQAIVNWVIEAVQENKNSNVLSKENYVEKNKSIAKEIEKKYFAKKEIVFGHDYIEFVYGPTHIVHLKFTEKSFREQIANNLRKLNLSVEFLK